MPSGKAHCILNLKAALPFGVGAAGVATFVSSAATDPLLALAAFAGGYLLSTCGVNPDQDLGHIRIFPERWPVWGMLLFWWSLPYGKLFRHRGISHWPVVGTLTRVLVMGLWIVPLLLWLFPQIPKLELFQYSLWAFAGLAVADLAHIAADLFLRD